ncbi:MAG: hypothetical protein WCV62_05580 [Candidatus Peribacteraceae bacterium]|jgi:hypothetical protein
MAAPIALLVSHALLSFGMLRGSASYDGAGFLCLLLSFALLPAALFLLRRKDFPRLPLRLPLALALTASLILASLRLSTHGPLAVPFGTTYVRWMPLLALLIPLAYLPPMPGKVRRGLFFAALGMAVLLRLWLPVASPAPRIDTYVVIQESAQHLLEGRNPYATPVTDVYGGKKSYGYDIKGYVYLPANLYPQAVATELAGDARYAHIAAELGFAFLLWVLARRLWSRDAAELIVLLALSHPLAIFVLDGAWTEPLILLSFALTAYALSRGKGALGAAAFGYAFSLKQYLVMLALPWLFAERRWKLLLLSGAVAVATLFPFLLWDWRSLLSEGVLLQLQAPFRQDTFSLFGFLSQTAGIVPPKWWTLLVSALASVLSAVFLRGLPRVTAFLAASVFTLYTTFLFGTQAFVNYYYLVSGMMLLLLAAGFPLPEPPEGRSENEKNI